MSFLNRRLNLFDLFTVPLVKQNIKFLFSELKLLALGASSPAKLFNHIPLILCILGETIIITHAMSPRVVFLLGDCHQQGADNCVVSL